MNEIVKHEQAGNTPLALTQEQRKILCATFFQGAPESYVQLALILAGKYGLDPFAREIFIVPNEKNPQKVFLAVARDGYLKIARNHPDFEGMSSGAIYEGMEIDVDHEKGTVKAPITAAMLGDKKKPVAAWAVVRRRGMVPTVKIAVFSEYNRPGSGYQSTWDKYPTTMIVKVAESQALRAAYGVSGVHPADEMGIDEFSGQTMETTASRIKDSFENIPPKTLTKGRQKALEEKANVTITEDPKEDPKEELPLETNNPAEVKQEQETNAEKQETKAPEPEEKPADAQNFATYCAAIRKLGLRAGAKHGMGKAGAVTKGRKLESMTLEEVQEVEMTFTELLAGE